MSTKQSFEDAMENIGWKFNKRSKNNRWLISPSGKRSQIRILESRLDFCHKESIFGQEYAGSINFDFDHCDLKLSEGCVCLMAKGNNDIFIQFYSDDN